MRYLIFIFILVTANALDDSHESDALIETKDGPKSSHDLIEDHPAIEGHPKGVISSPDVIPHDATKVVGVPSETLAGRPLVLDKPDIVATSVPAKSRLPSEDVAPAATGMGVTPSILDHIKGEEVRPKSDEAEDSEDSKYTTKVPKETVAVAHKKLGDDKIKVATATKVETKTVTESPEEAKLPTINPDHFRRRRDASSSSEEADKEKDGSAKEKVPTETVAAVAEKFPGQDTKVATVEKPLDHHRRKRSSSSSESHEHGGIITPVVNSPVATPVNTGYPAVNTGTAVGAPPAGLGAGILRVRRDGGGESKSSEESDDEDGNGKTVKVPTEPVAVAKKKPGENTKVATATKLEEVQVTEQPEEKHEDSAFTTKIPKEALAVAHKKPGEDTKVATGIKQEVKTVTGNPEEANLPTISPDRRRRDTSKSSEEEGKDKFTTKVPTESVAVAKKKPGEDTEVATATKVKEVEVSGNPEAKDLPTISPDARVRRQIRTHIGVPAQNFHGSIHKRDASSSSEENSKDDKATEDGQETTKVPTEAVAVVEKFPGQDPKVATATKVEEKPVVRRHVEPDSKSSEEKEDSGAQSPSLPVVEEVPVETKAVAHKKADEAEPEIAAIAKVPIDDKEGRVRRDNEESGKHRHRPGPSEDDMAAGDPAKLERKSESRARRYAL